MSDEDIVGALSRPGAYPWPVDTVEFVETHISWVFLAGERVIKLKRPVRYNFVDYSTLEKRHRACQDEVRLNRLLADDVYLGVVSIVRDGDGFRVGGERNAEAVEWATLMRRLDASEMLDVRLRTGRVPADLANRLAARLVPFHLEVADQCRGPVDEVLRDQLGVVTENLDELQPFSGDALPAYELGLVRRAMHAFIKRHDGLLRARVEEGWIREGHGDLRCEHVAVPDSGPVHIYDCVEFNRDLRCADVASDLAFLLMDLFRLNAPTGVRQELLGRYAAAGADLPAPVLGFYWIHRALVRAKVECLRLPDADAGQRIRILGNAVEYLHVASRQAITTSPAVLAMTGLSGTGKSTVAVTLARILGASYVSSDEVRKSLANREGAAAASWGEGIYTAEWTARTYRELMETAANAVAAGKMVVLDATFLDSHQREVAARVAKEHGVPFVLIETVTDPDVTLRRLDARQKRGEAVSDATGETWRRQRELYEADPPAIPEGTIPITIDTSPEGPVSLDAALSALESAGLLSVGIEDAAARHVSGTGPETTGGPSRRDG